MLKIFTPLKIQRLRPGLNAQTCVPDASMLTTRPPKLSKSDKKTNSTLHEDQYTFFIISRLVLRRMKYISDKSSRETQNTYLCKITFFSKIMLL